MVETAIREEVLQVLAPGATWLSTGWDGGYHRADAAYNISVPTGWDRKDLSAYVRERLTAARFDVEGPALLTGVDLAHAVGARLEPVTVVATVGLTNPASLPMDPEGPPTSAAVGIDSSFEDDAMLDPGTVNLIVVTDRALDRAGLATLLGAVFEAKAATLQQLTGFTGTTSDAVVVGTDPDGEPSPFAGSATVVGNAARAGVREAVCEGIRARDADTTIPESVADADAGIRTDSRAEVFEI